MVHALGTRDTWVPTPCQPCMCKTQHQHKATEGKEDRETLGFQAPCSKAHRGQTVPRREAWSHSQALSICFLWILSVRACLDLVWFPVHRLLSSPVPLLSGQSLGGDQDGCPGREGPGPMIRGEKCSPEEVRPEPKPISLTMLSTMAQSKWLRQSTESLC